VGEAVTVPLVRAPGPGGAPPEPADSGPRPRILVVEDHEDSRDMLREFLQFEGYDVEVAADGRVGIDAALERRPVVVLIDLGLPLVDGFQVARAIRERLGHNIWLVALTSRTTPADRRRSAEAGFDLHVAKPVAIDRLRGILRDIVSRAH